ncbi:hypothetical protein [Nocardioides daeguensis]|uniref:Type IV toxin-antitoxin system AbiEi family antitoxin domain-containing protein n=1 Tax=Nocardioides daeguensis TaxID=908359 RepID=A0ABP6VF93_9ACTN|nr:hypothetical protein [Nocardioides daeguensis]MBV6729415.1 hypothetical protein [Nocardioides daeguensis]MCR1771812.1 hypothetical protein [Nocardioides daeguensis]
MDEIENLLDLQDGVIARRQALAAGCTAATLRRRIRRREWAVVHPGVYVSHTGPLTWQQRAWAAVLTQASAALAGRSAVRAHEGTGRQQMDAVPIEIIVPSTSHPAKVAGIVVRRSRRFEETVQRNLHPPRQRYDDAILELADTADDPLRLIAVLADACGGRRTTAERLVARLAATPRMRQRRLIEAVLADVAEGTCSVLERAYLSMVERPHGLPRGERQVAARTADGRRIYCDVVYRGRDPAWVQHVELDGLVFHDSVAQRDRDLERDLDAAVELAGTVRLGYGQVLGRACSTAAKVGLLLQRRGWSGAASTCPECSGS